MCSIGLVLYTSELFTHKNVADYSLVLPFILIALLAFDLKFIGRLEVTAIAIAIVNIIGKVILLKEFNIQTGL
ncbi:hypothetical protein [[Clostridium] polysaccharolyticum]|jgi:hypothetical protein|uniref:Uncharacterized protein n=1 Tax=[Clostridium] polysaccharolyticum TaxID=29364 RepID=A0A1I0G5N2_9FIRM|nr:hypothetical protein [[Clostridium] polysaccharolyticum]SET65356.1 hypothetical protein SAMN04487772_1465 [[Clostridium] polysaccharolyticum]